MGLRPGRCYKNPSKNIKGQGARGFRRARKQKRSYTRIAIKVPRKNFIGAAPALRIRQFNMGNPLKKYNTIADLKVSEGFDLRDNAIESARMAINRQLVKALGKDGFFMKVRVFPSNIMRENKTAQGAGADRVSQGMSMSFGKPIGRSARLRKGQIVFSVLCMKSQKTIVKKALMRAKARFSSSVKVYFSEDVKSIGTMPTKKIREVETKTTEKVEEGKEGEKKEGKEKVDGKEKKEEGKETKSKEGKPETEKKENKK
jgi:large subunit ribosomal protein L10e